MVVGMYVGGGAVHRLRAETLPRVFGRLDGTCHRVPLRPEPWEVRPRVAEALGASAFPDINLYRCPNDVMALACCLETRGRRTHR